jgi:hypothetical protein
MNATGTPLIVLHDVGREQRFARGITNHIGRQELEIRPRVWVTVEIAVDRVRATLLHPEKFGGALIELVVASGVQLETKQAGCLDGRLVMEQCRDQRAGADEVADGDDDRVAGRGRRTAQVGGEVLGAARAAVRAERAVDVAVEIVDGEDTEIHRA